MSTKFRSDDERVDILGRFAAQQGVVTMSVAVMCFCPVLTIPALAVSAAVVRRTFRD
jgi:hypothetical protein